jgi:hypothetical protein
LWWNHDDAAPDYFLLEKTKKHTSPVTFYIDMSLEDIRLKDPFLLPCVIFNFFSKVSVEVYTTAYQPETA